MEVVAACHMHSEWSYDGSWSLEALNSTFARRGYRILMMTEHDRGFSQARFDEYRVACARASSDTMLMVPGIEYSDVDNRVHTLTWGLSEFLGEGRPTMDTLRAVKDANAVAVLAHPSRKNAWACFEPVWADGLFGIELWNRKYDGWAPGDAAPALLRSTGAIPFVGMDFHTDRQSFPLAMVLDVRGAVSEDSVLASLRARRCEARAFGVTIGRVLFRAALPILAAAEYGRRRAASIKRYSKGVRRAERVHPKG